MFYLEQDRIADMSRGRPTVFGVSGMVSKNFSTPRLNFLTYFWLGLLMYFGCLSFSGSKLNSCGALLKKEAPRIVSTQSGAFKFSFGVTFIPFRVFLSMEERSSPGFG